MLKKGNGRPERCVANLISMSRGECPYDRIKGINPDFVGMAYVEAKAQIKSDIKWLIRTYEPRVDIDNINVDDVVIRSGRFTLSIDTSMASREG